MKEEQIITLSKEEFDALPLNEKQIAVAKDVIARIYIKQIIPLTGNFCEIFNNYGSTYSTQLSEELKKPKLQCHTCAKGGLFLAYIGIVNSYEIKGNVINNGENIDSNEMNLLSDVFSKEQLSLIETAFEGIYYPWNKEITKEEKENCFLFRDNFLKSEYKTPIDVEDKRERDFNVLIAICENIIENNGTFKP